MNRFAFGVDGRAVIEPMGLKNVSRNRYFSLTTEMSLACMDDGDEAGGRDEDNGNRVVGALWVDWEEVVTGGGGIASCEALGRRVREEVGTDDDADAAHSNTLMGGR